MKIKYVPMKLLEDNRRSLMEYCRYEPPDPTTKLPEIVHNGILWILNVPFTGQLVFTGLNRSKYSSNVSCELLGGLHHSSLRLQKFYDLAIRGEIQKNGVTNPLLLCFNRSYGYYHLDLAK